ncbi:MAG: Hsp70 family protein [Planctomycetia bacterium]|nr:Hsp70 family protein [Planctomycetia bacterium]
MTQKYVIGIDLGTTNCVLVYAPLGEESGEECQAQLLPISQQVDANTWEERSTLPSFLYVESPQKWIVGEYARRLSEKQPQRTIHSAKSWLCNGRVDRLSAILPWGAELSEEEKCSPVEVSERYLKHLIAAWEEAFPEAPISQQCVVLTVPASFDASARELTHQAAMRAGLPEDMILLEEPQAAIYSWLHSHGDHWRKILKKGDSILICDVGGGTTDLSLIIVEEEEGELRLRRQAVGNHLLVGGDNMDLALAYHATTLFEAQKIKVERWPSAALQHSCRVVKEKLLNVEAPESLPVTLLGRGSKLVGGTVGVEMSRNMVQKLILDGFFPMCKKTDRPHRDRMSGFREIGLSYEADAGITKHIAAFLQDHEVFPKYVLYNGGVFQSELLRQRLLDVIQTWSDLPQEKILPLEGVHDLDFAVAKGAAFYGYAKKKGGIRIRGGTARAYYVGIETSGPAIPGIPRPIHALCVAPMGMEEGTEADVPGEEIGVVVGEKERFRIFSSSTRKDDKIGDVLEYWGEEELQDTDSLEAILETEEQNKSSYVPIKFHCRVTELGLFELWCCSTSDEQKWKLEFNVRSES